MPFEALMGQVCWGIAAGAGTGSHVAMHFGPKQKRNRVISNPNLSDDLRSHEGSLILFVECEWSLMSRGQNVCDSDSDNAAQGPMIRGLQRLVGAQVVSIFSSRKFDLVAVNFSKGLRLFLAASALPAQQHENYALSLPQVSFILGPDTNVRVESRRQTATNDDSVQAVFTNPPWVQWSTGHRRQGSLMTWAKANKKLRHGRRYKGEELNKVR